MIHMTAKKHDGPYIVHLVEECLKSHNLSLRQVTTITSDNGKNVIFASKTLVSKIQMSLEEERLREFTTRQLDRQHRQHDPAKDEEGPEEDEFYVDDWDDIDEEIDDEEFECTQPSDELLDAFKEYKNTRIIRCAAHTVQLGVNDYLQKDKVADSFVKKANKEAVFWRNKINKRGWTTPVPALSNDTR